jgi:heme exporter protein C
MPGEMRLTFLVSLVAMTLLFATLWKVELTSKHASDQLRKLRRRLDPEPDDVEAAAQPVGAVN